MSVQRKCPTCNHWNNNETHCSQCNTLLDPILIEDEREKVREEVRNKQVSKLDIFLKKWEESPYFLVRLSYKILYSIAVIFFSIAGFFAWLAASPNG